MFGEKKKTGCFNLTSFLLSLDAFFCSFFSGCFFIMIKPGEVMSGCRELLWAREADARSLFIK